jgi:hypothetical protein
MTNLHNEAVTSAITTDDLAKVVAYVRFFGYRSVDINVLVGVADVNTARGMTATAIQQDGTWPGQDGGFIDRTCVRENEKPWLKIQDFNAKMRSGIGQQLDLAQTSPK